MPNELTLAHEFDKGTISNINQIHILLSDPGSKTKGFSQRISNLDNINKNQKVHVNISIQIIDGD